MARQTDYLIAHRRGPGPGHPVDGGELSGRTFTAATYIQFGAAAQRAGGKKVEPLAPGGVFEGIAKAAIVTRDGVGNYEPYDNVPVQDAGHWWGVADKAIPAGAALNWNSATLRWTDQPPGGSVVATPGVEASEAANGNGHEIPIRIKRVRAN